MGLIKNPCGFTRPMYVSLQLHITGRCNLRCTHCYMEEHASEVPYADVKRALKQFDELIGRLKKQRNEQVVPLLRITGGEPLMHKDVLEILRYVRRKGYIVGIMSNGTLLNEKILCELKKIKRLQAFQVSIDGDEGTHDLIRGRGNYKDTVGALDLLYANGIKTRVSFTANADNFRQFSNVATVCRKHHVSSLWSDRCIPFAFNQSTILTKDMMPDYIALLKREAENPLNATVGLRVENHRALQFIGSDHATPYYCKAGEELITVDEKGSIMPCRRLPIDCGNIADTTLSDVYLKHEVFTSLRSHELPKECSVCEHACFCKGGARCMAYAVTGDFIKADPGCFLI